MSWVSWGSLILRVWFEGSEKEIVIIALFSALLFLPYVA